MCATDKAAPPNDVSYYIFVANDLQGTTSEAVSASTIFEELSTRGFWAFTAAAPLRAKLCSGDQVLLYLAGLGRRHFVAAVTLGSVAMPLEPVHSRVFEELGIPFFEYSVSMKSVRRLAEPIAIKPLVHQLSFITDKVNYGLHLRLPIVRISKEDYELITSEAKLPLR